MNQLLGALVAVTLLAACVSFTPGRGVDEEFAGAWGCSESQVAARAEVLKAALGSGRQYIPRVGWSSCELMAHNGKPTRVDYQRTATITAASWWYQSDSETHLISLTREQGQWIVTYVGW